MKILSGLFAMAGACLLTVQTLPAQTSVQLRSWLIDAPGWDLSKETEVFNPDNLFDRINGAAPLFIENNFREMTSLEYKKGDDYITIQVYRHATPEDAFGMYASERSGELTYFSIGGEAQGDEKNLYFFAGSFYVKMWSNSDAVQETLQSIGNALAKRIDPAASYPVIVKCFPEKGKIPHTEAYITKGYIGHEFLRSVYTAKYERDGRTFQLFVLDAGSGDGVKSVLSDYFTFTGQPSTFEEGVFQIKDKYNGDLPVIRKNRYLVGIYSEDGKTIQGAELLLRESVKKLP